NAAEIPQIASVSLPKLEGLVYLCVTENSVLIVQNDNIYTSSIDSVDLLHLLADATVEKRCFDAKPLYRAAFAAGKTARNITFDAKLAAYLLNPAASSYTVVRLAQEYGIVAAFAGDLPEAGVLAPLCDILRKKI
ncbi:MAG: DNA polymerase I, partial [Ruthenibacterium sp.]